MKKYKIRPLELNLYQDFKGHSGTYPVECFYHFYAYKLLPYDYVVNIEADFYTNKPLDVDMKTIRYVGGSYHPAREIANFPCIARDRDAIMKTFPTATFSGYRILGGFRIYHPPFLRKIRFYETMVQLYRKSRAAGIPRLGDDSLMVLYQMLYPDNVTLLEPLTHVIFHRDIETVHQVTHCHFVGNRKYWDNIPHTGVDLYFSQKAIQYLYNHFPSEFIELHFPNIYMERCRLRFWYWQGKPNFGDLLTPYFLKRFCNPKEYTLVKNKTGPKVISCGSIMSACTVQTLVYGAGIRDRKQDIQNGIIQIVRGPITRQRLLELNHACPPTYGDPGLLLPKYYHPTIKKRVPLGIIPHYLHYEKARTIFKDALGAGQVSIIRLLNPNIEDTIDAILACEAVVSSSLHGLIVADAYGIPNKWIYFDDAITGDNTKYYDYFAP